MPEIIGISRLLEIAPAVKTRPLVDLAHRRLSWVSDEELSAHISHLFQVCWLERLTPSEALSLAWGSNVGIECGFRKLTPAGIWEMYGRPSYDAWLKDEPRRSAPRLSEAASLPVWWGSRFELWAALVAPDLPATFRRAIGWSLLSTLLGEHVATPVGAARIPIALAGTSSRTREDALRLGGAIALSVQSSALVSLAVESGRLTATEPDNVTSPEALRERQAPPDHRCNSTLALLISEALDGLERVQAASDGPLMVKSSDGALDAVTAFRADLAPQLRTLAPDILDEVLSGSAVLVRSMGALVAVAEGSTIISELHQGIAVRTADESVRGLARYLNTGRWLA